jgi:dTDP-4-dehydrorhamnose 3,5-epimerase
MPFTFEKTIIPGLIVVRPRVFPDGRGFFVETYKESDFVNNGINVKFKQDNHSCSSKGVLRGLHLQKGSHAQGKLVRVTAGKVWDVAVDLRPDSPTFKKWYGIELSSENKTMFYIPPGFAHGFVTLEDNTEFMYKCTEEFNKESEGAVRWNDPEIAIEWPLTDVLVSDKDAENPLLKDIDFKTVWKNN